jgi:uncharacterized protein (TIGR01777 family)
MKVLLTGATGYVGQFTGRRLVKEGFEVVALTRNPSEARLSFPAQIVDLDTLKKVQEIDYVIHLAGASIADQRWTSSYKKTLYKSRVDFTQRIIDAINVEQVKSWVQMSATGLYKPQSEPQITEENGQKAEGFLGDLVEDWEASVDKLNTRVIKLRMGMVIGENSHALEKMIPLFRSGLGAVLGSGKQYMPWIHIEDAVSVMVDSLKDTSFQGVYNLTAPELVQNKVFTKELSQVLKVRTLLPPAPSFSLKILYGEMSQILLSSLPVYPERLAKKGFKFKYEKLKEALSEAVPKLETGERILTRMQWIPKPIDETFEFFQNEKNLEDITPPSLNFRVLKKSTDRIEEGTLIDYKLRINGVPISWRTLISSWSPPNRFSDQQLKGPYKKWYHVHEFSPLGSGTLMEDRVIYKLPLGLVGRIFGMWYVKRDVNKIFNYRWDKVKDIFKVH